MLSSLGMRLCLASVCVSERRCVPPPCYFDIRAATPSGDGTAWRVCHNQDSAAQGAGDGDSETARIEITHLIRHAGATQDPACFPRGDDGTGVKSPRGPERAGTGGFHSLTDAYRPVTGATTAERVSEALKAWTNLPTSFRQRYEGARNQSLCRRRAPFC